jgi:hypothetical protein
MFLRYSYQLCNVHRHPLHVRPRQELQVEAEEAEAEEVEAEAGEEEEQTLLASDSAETLLKYSQEKERKQTASSPNSNATIWPTSESQNLTPGSEKSSSPAPISKALSLINGSTGR